jgi:hypothetical protein
VIDTVCQAVYQPSSGDIDVDLYLNMMRVIFGYLLFNGDFPQAQDVVGGGRTERDPAVVAKLAAVVDGLPSAPPFAGFHQDAAAFTDELACLVTPYIRRCIRNQQVRIKLDVDPAIEGYRDLYHFLDCTPWIAQVTEDHADMIVGADESPAASLPADFTWYANALDLPVYRESLIHALSAVRKEKQAVLAPEV